MIKKKLNIEICSSLDDVKYKINLVLSKLSKTIDDDDIIFDIRTILTELIMNGVIHGNSLDYNKKVFLDILLEKDYMSMYVRDEGFGFEHSIDSYDVYDMKSSGRGLVIVRGLCDELDINNNEVFVRKRLGKSLII